MTPEYKPTQVIPAQLGKVVDPLPYWFVIGGHAVRCFCPYRPSRDVDFGVDAPGNLQDLLEQLERTGKTEILERSHGTLHLLWNGINISIFVLDSLVPFTHDRSLNVTGILATKLHAILDRGTRRDFFDMYVTLQHHKLGLADCLGAMREVYGERINDALLLRALTYFDDAEREAPLPKEGPDDWKTVTEYFLTRAGQLLIPPARALQIQSNTVDVSHVS